MVSFKQATAAPAAAAVAAIDRNNLSTPYLPGNGAGIEQGGNGSLTASRCDLAPAAWNGLVEPFCRRWGW
jgi:hypothetical protein